MAVPESPIDKLKLEGALDVLVRLPQALDKIRYDLRFSATSTLAAAIIGAMGRPVSIKEAIEIQQDIYNTNYGGELAGYGHYQEWKKTSEERLNKVRA